MIPMMICLECYNIVDGRESLKCHYYFVHNTYNIVYKQSAIRELEIKLSISGLKRDFQTTKPTIMEVVDYTLAHLRKGK